MVILNFIKLNKLGTVKYNKNFTKQIFFVFLYDMIKAIHGIFDHSHRAYLVSVHGFGKWRISESVEFIMRLPRSSRRGGTRDISSDSDAPFAA